MPAKLVREDLYELRFLYIQGETPPTVTGADAAAPTPGAPDPVPDGRAVAGHGPAADVGPVPGADDDDARAHRRVAPIGVEPARRARGRRTQRAPRRRVCVRRARWIRHANNTAPLF